MCRYHPQPLLPGGGDYKMTPFYILMRPQQNTPFLHLEAPYFISSRFCTGMQNTSFLHLETPYFISSRYCTGLQNTSSIHHEAPSIHKTK